MTRLSNNQGVFRREAVLGNFQVQGSRAFPDTAGDVVVRAVAGAEPATKVTSLANGHTTKVSADAYKSERSGLSIPINT